MFSSNRFEMSKSCCCGCGNSGGCRNEEKTWNHPTQSDLLIEAEWRIYASVNHVIIGSDNGLAPDRPQAIIWTNAAIKVAPGNPTLWRGVPVTSIQKSFGSSGRDWKSMKKSPIPCKFCTYWLITYPSTRCDKVRIDPLMVNIRNPDFSFFPVANVAWFVVARPC